MTETEEKLPAGCCACSEDIQPAKLATESSKQQAAEKELEFAVNMTCQSCADAVQRAIDSRPEGEVSAVRIHLAEQRVLLRTRLHVDTVLELLESTGLRAVLQGVGTASDGMSGLDFASGVAQIEGIPTLSLSTSDGTGGGSGARGVVRILQPDDAECLFDGTVDCLEAGRKYSIEVRQGGDMSRGAESCGQVFRDQEGDVSESGCALPAGKIGHTLANDSGRIRFSLASRRLQLWCLIGRCLSISDAVTGQVHGLGVIARSAGLFANEKRLCSCDGVEIWNERDVPVAGAGRATAAAAVLNRKG